MGSDVLSSPAVAHGVVYVGSSGGTFAAFDAAGTLKCSGTPKTCTPLWKADNRELRRLVAGGRRRHRLRRFGRRQPVRVRHVVERVPRRCRSHGVTARRNTRSTRATSRASRSSPFGLAFDIVQSSPAVANGFVYSRLERPHPVRVRRDLQRLRDALRTGMGRPRSADATLLLTRRRERRRVRRLRRPVRVRCGRERRLLPHRRWLGPGVHTPVARKHGRERAVFTGVRERHGVRRRRRPQALRIRRVGNDRLLRHACALCAAVDRQHGRCHPLVTGGRGRRRLRRLRRRQAVRVQRDRHDRLLGHTEDVHAAVDRSDGRADQVVTGRRRRLRLRRVERQPVVCLQRQGHDRLHRYAEGLRADLDRD